MSFDLQGAEEMGHMEHLLNVYASKAAKGSIADFVGYIEVDDEHATTKLTQGLWLVCPNHWACTPAGLQQAPVLSALWLVVCSCVFQSQGVLILQMWRYQGSRTLAYYLRRRDCIAALAEDLAIEQEAVVATVFKQVLESIAVSAT